MKTLVDKLEQNAALRLLVILSTICLFAGGTITWRTYMDQTAKQNAADIKDTQRMIDDVTKLVGSLAASLDKKIEIDKVTNTTINVQLQDHEARLRSLENSRIMRRY